jgi:hypothetical protein
MKTPPAFENFDQLNHCPVCGSRYGQNSVLVLEESDKQSTFHLSCRECGSSIVVFLSAGQFGIVSVGMATDLKSEEARLFYKQDPISADQVLEIHEILKKM